MAVNRCLTAAVLVSLAACAVYPGPRAGRWATGVSFTILQLNDVYELMPLGGSGFGGLARVATLKKRLLRENPNTFMVLAGDLLSPSAMSSARAGDGGAALNGQHMVDIMNRIGLDYATFGNHEFDLRKENFDKRMAESKFTWFSSNVFATDMRPFPNVRQNVVLTVPELKLQPTAGRMLRIGMFGLTIDSNSADYVRYADPVETARQQVAALKDKADVIIALTHLAIAQDEQLAESVPGLAMILGGHEHQNIKVLRGNDFVPVLKADSNAKSAYVHRLRYNPQTRRLDVDSELIEIDDSIPEDPEVAAAARAWVEKAFAAFKRDGIEPDKVVTTLTEMMEGRETYTRTGSTNLTREINQALIDAFAGAEVSIYNSGSIRIDDTLGPGPITQYDVLRVLPYRGDLFLTTMKGSMLEKIASAGREPSRRGAGSWLQIAGITGPIDPNRDYRVVINDYLLNGSERGLEWIKPEMSGITVMPDPSKEFRQTVIARLGRRAEALRYHVSSPNGRRYRRTSRTAPHTRRRAAARAGMARGARHVAAG
jgi:5'-nucleotidase / UDP-sugar diphosphatase